MESPTNGGKTLGQFIFNGQNGLKPKHYGYYSVKWSIDNTAQTIQTMGAVLKASTLAKAILKYPYAAHLHLISLQVASYYAYASSVLSVSKDVLNEIHIGIQDGLATLNGVDDKTLSADAIATLLAAIRGHVQVLHKEINSLPLDPKIVSADVSPSTSLVVKSIANEYGLLKFILDNPIEDVQFQTLVAAHGSLFMDALKNDVGLKYVP